MYKETFWWGEKIAQRQFCISDSFVQRIKKNRKEVIKKYKKKNKSKINKKSRKKVTDRGLGLTVTV